MAAAEARWCGFPLEPPWGPDVRDFLLTETLGHDDGTITPPDDPGQGVEVEPSLLG